MAEVVLDNVVKIYPGEVKAVDNANLHIRDGELIVLVGPSGCGKSTTLRMVAGLEEISEGTISIGETIVNEIHPKDRDIAMVFQDYALYPHMTVYQNMAFGLKLRKYPREEIDQRIHEAAKVLGLEPYLERKPKALSGGQRQRVAVGRAIVRHPKVFLFDEPLSNLDAKLRVEMRAELKRIHRQLKTTTIYVTHDQEEAMTLGDRIVIMKDGIIQQCGTPLDVYMHPANRFVASFVGTPPMNLFTGTLVANGEALYFDEGSTKIRLLPTMAKSLAGHVGQEVVLGIRPEALSPVTDGRFAGTENSLPAEIIVMEPLGEKIDVYALTPTHPKIIARIDPCGGLEEGKPVTFHLDMDRVHIFAGGDTGVNLLFDRVPVAAEPKVGATL
ncbi:MAG TPA: sn-glycerol-3-phosphate ABC transporter ATP-binding protein UgpC [Armatimonadota bacterium]|jgi:multiple sugar transport system ATP-binding protein